MVSGALQGIHIEQPGSSVKGEEKLIKDEVKAEKHAEEYYSSPVLVTHADLARGQQLGLSTEEIFRRRNRSYGYDQKCGAVAVVYLCAAKGAGSGQEVQRESGGESGAIRQPATAEKKELVDLW
ncbi:hypothetical protein Slin15195_G130390 [Septoria linicola]|uniref:Uncharacterized protein n=1 Tax=Septoria linicola TaxID=215465 RepID=A0A9Q9B321_9PEZI|nr:hypothetical protein Slin15195_G130390 [Septoria linicola]